MIKIFKYPLEITKQQGLSLPTGAKILKVDMQHSKLYLWAQVVDGTGSEELRHFCIHGTGQEIVDAHLQRHLATVFDGGFVWHVYEYFAGKRNV